MRAIRCAGRAVRLFGVEGYNSAKGGDAIFKEVLELRPGVVLMESFAAEGEDVRPGAVVPYRRILPAQGLARVLQRAPSPEFQRGWTAEAMAVLAALSADAEVRLGDRLHVASFDRLVDARSLDSLRASLVLAVEAVAGALAKKLERQGPPVKISDLPQNFVCPMFKELGAERHALMAHFARLAAEEGHDVAVVVGAEHLDGVEGALGQGAADLEELMGPGGPGAAEGSAEWKEELEKRCAVAAFLASTGTFPPEVVLPHPEQLLPAAKEQATKYYPKYSSAFRERLRQALRGAGGAAEEKPQDLQDALGEATAERTRGLLDLRELCLELGGLPSSLPPTPPPPPAKP